MSMRANGGGSSVLRHPTVIVFLLGVIGAVVGWAVRQEVINQSQQSQIDALTRDRLGPNELSRRLGSLEGRLDTIERLLQRKDRQ